MWRILVLSLLFLGASSYADERMADVASYVQAVWFAEEFNEHCRDSGIKVPISELELRELLIMTDDRNMVDEVAYDPAFPDRNSRDDMKDIATKSVVDGCDSELANTFRAKVEKLLLVPDLLVELKDIKDNR